MPISSRQFVGSTLALLVIGFVALCMVVAANIWLGERARTYSEEVIQARDVKALAVDLRGALQEAESSQRGFLYTENEIYLAPYDKAKRQVQKALAALPDRLGPYPQLNAAMARLQVVVAEKLQGMDQLIQFKRSDDDASALALVRTNKGKLLTDEANLFASGIELAADGRLRQLVQEQTENALFLRLISVVGGIVIIGVALLAMITIIKYTRELSEARRALSLSNDRLEERVAARTAELEESRNRAQTLLAEVNHRVANSLALVTSLISIQSRSSESDAAKAALEEVRARVQAVAMVHRRLYEDGKVQTVALDEYLTGLLEQFKTSIDTSNGVSLSYRLEPMVLKTDASINLGVVVTEWVLNAIKYAYPDRPGEVRVILERDAGGTATLRVEDDGVGHDVNAKAKGTGVGTRIVRAMAASMDATIDYVTGSPGLSARFSFPIGGT